jgi:hypothetical protein
LLDSGLTWQMVPSDVQRGPLMVQQINDLEAKLAKERKREHIKLGVVFRDDALGVGTFAALSDLTLNGKPLADAVNLGTNVFVDAYQAGASEQGALVDAYTQFAPDILVLVGTSEVVTELMVPLEQAWPDGTPRPQYLLTDSTKVSELLDAISGNDELRKRVRGTGVTPSNRSQPVFNAFRVSYELRYPGATANVSGMGPSYDAAYAIAFALAASKSLPVRGTNIATGLRQLSGGATEIQLQETQVLAAFQRLSRDQSIDAVGTFGPLAWTENGAIQGGTVEMWCVGKTNDGVGFQGAGVTLEIETGKTRGEYVQCP